MPDRLMQAPAVFMGKAAAPRKPPVRVPRFAVDKKPKAAQSGFMIRATFLALFATFATSFSAHAAEQSAVVTYPVSGNTAKAIYNDIKINSPKIAPNATFAYTAMAHKTVKSHKVDGNGCRYKRFETSMIYNFVIPKRESSNPLMKGLEKKWSNFTAYLLKHEEGHRAIWRKCIANYDQQALTLVAPNCEELDQQREALFTSVKQGCVRQDEAYDVIFRKEVVNHAFMREAFGGSANNRN